MYRTESREDYVNNTNLYNQRMDMLHNKLSSASLGTKEGYQRQLEQLSAEIDRFHDTYGARFG